MSKLLETISEAFNEGRQKAKTEAESRRKITRHKENNKVIVFGKDGRVMLATLHGESVRVENLENYRECPDEILSKIPSDILERCKKKSEKNAPQYLYLEREDGELYWKTSEEPAEE